MNWKDLYLPIGIVSAFIFGFILTDIGLFLHKLSWGDIKLNHAIIFLIFVLSGYQIKLDDVGFNKSFLLTIIVGFTINLICAPFIAKYLLFFLPLNDVLKLGVLTISCVPTTLATGTMLTEVSKSNVPWAIILTIVYSIAGIFVLPFTYSFVVETTNSVSIDSFAIFKTLSIMVILPAMIGYLIKIKKPGIKNVFTQYYQPTGIILIVFMAVSKGRDNIYSLNLKDFFILIFAVVFIHVTLLGLSFFYGYIKKLPKKNSRALAIISSQKTLPLSLTLLLVLPADIASQAAIACLLFHLSQVFVDSFLAYKWGKEENC